MSDQINLSAVIPDELGNRRLDQIAAELFPDFSRARLQTWIKDGQLTVDGKAGKPKEKAFGGQVLAIAAELQDEGTWEPQDIKLDIVYEDEHILVINKPADLVVHPAAGNYDGTLLNGLLYHCPELIKIPRAGIVHRLDKDTTGLMVVAKTLQAQNHLVDQLQSREMGREYEAVVMGVMTGGGTVEQKIGRHPRDRLKMAVTNTGKEAVTHYRVLQKFRAHTHIRLKLETGRTHQIRVHMAYIQYPIVGDQLYASRTRLPKGVSEDLRARLRDFSRQALHARKLELYHPATDELVSWEVPLSQDFIDLLEALREDMLNADLD